ncbi:MAG: YjbQ family protein, partial [Acidobacteriota bacterium]
MEIQVVSDKRCQVVELTATVRAKCREWGKSGIVHLYCPHTTAGIAINEIADPTVKADYLAHVEKL